VLQDDGVAFRMRGKDEDRLFTWRKKKKWLETHHGQSQSILEKDLNNNDNHYHHHHH
jgi:hypothetical protein